MTDRSYWHNASHDELIRQLQWLEEKTQVTFLALTTATGALSRINQALGENTPSEPAWIAGEVIAWLRRCPDVEWVCPDCGGDREQCGCEWPVEGE